MKKILIIGESCRDIFVYCDAERLAPDLPIPVLNVIETKENPGMAMNVDRNIKSIISDCDIVTNSGWEKITKTRYMDKKSNHAFIRVDTSHKIPRIDISKVKFKKYSLVVISDYNKGFLTEDDIKYVCENHNNVFIDTKKILGSWAKDAKFIKINNYEYERSKEKITKNLKDKIIVTKGEYGATYKGKEYPVGEKFEVKDTTGAGDSFFAALVVKYSQTENIDKAIAFANERASEVVKHRGVTLI